MLVWAHAYDRHSVSLVSDHEFDAECYKVNLTLHTGKPQWDRWWRKHFVPCTGMWINDHPDREGIERLYRVVVHEGRPK